MRRKHYSPVWNILVRAIHLGSGQSENAKSTIHLGGLYTEGYMSKNGFTVNARGRRGGSVVSASHLGPEGRGFEPWPVYPRSILEQKTDRMAFLGPGSTKPSNKPDKFTISVN